jgi:ribosomal protein S18 acetylase RimI-like enzyme
MRAAPGSFRFRKIAEPKGDPALASFSSGSGTHPAEVDRLVARLYEGTNTVKPTVLVLEGPHGEVIGIVAYRPRPLAALEQLQDAVYIHCIAISAVYRGSRLEGGEPPATVLLREALGRIREESGGSMPAVWALIHHDNRAAHKLLEREGFEYIETARGNDAIRFRPAGLLETP